MRKETPEIERVAIWTAHSKRCAYCGEPLRYPDLEIDHILPRKLTKKQDELRSLISQLELPLDFSIVGLANLLPAHRTCNSRKTDKVFNQANARFFLELADKKQKSIKDLIPKLELEAARDKLLALVRAALQSGDADLGDIMDAAAKTDKFPLNAIVNFESGSWDVAADSEKIDRLFDEPVRLPVQPKVPGVRFTDGNGSEISVSTCREYKAAIAASYYPSDNLNLKISFALATTSAILEAASRARLATISYIRSPRSGITDFGLLPATLAPIRHSHRSDLASLSESATIKDLIKAGTISASILSETQIGMECDGHGIIMTELMRADFDDDGVEEILLEIRYYIKLGTFRQLSIGLLHKRDAESPFDYRLWNAEIEMAQHRHQIARIMR